MRGTPPVVSTTMFSLKLTVKSRFCPVMYVPSDGTLTLATTGTTASTTILLRPPRESAPPTVGKVKMARSLVALANTAPLSCSAAVLWKSRSALTSPACTVYLKTRVLLPEPLW